MQMKAIVTEETKTPDYTTVLLLLHPVVTFEKFNSIPQCQPCELSTTS